MIEHFFTCPTICMTVQKQRFYTYANAKFPSAEGSRADEPHLGLS